MTSELMRQLGAARAIQQRLEVMGQVAEGVQVKQPGAALEGVEGAENGVDRPGVGWIFLEPEDALLDGLQQFEGFAVELAKQLGIVRQVQTDGGFIWRQGWRGQLRSAEWSRTAGSDAGVVEALAADGFQSARSRRHLTAAFPRREDGTHPRMPMVQEPDGFLREFARPIENLVQQRAGGRQTGGKDGRRAFAGQFLEIHDQAVDRQEPGVLARFDESQFLAQLG